jgi:hypothetical protein
MQQSFGLEQMRLAFQKYVQDSDLQFKYFAEILGVELEEAKIVGNATVDIARAKRAANEQAGTETGSNGTGGQSPAAPDPGTAP